MYVPHSSQFKKISIALLCAAFVIVAIALFLQAHRPAPAKIDTEYGKVFKDYAGNEVRLSQFGAGHVIVFMWASWCPYCAQELQNLAEMKKQMGGKIEVVAVNRGEPLGDAKAFTDKLGTEDSVHFLLDPNDALYKSVNGYAMPETLFIDSKAQIVFHQRGPMQKTALSAKLAELEK